MKNTEGKCAGRERSAAKSGLQDLIGEEVGRQFSL